MLRILVVLPLYGGSLSIGRYAAQGLKDVGCLVETFESPVFYSAFEGLKSLQVGAHRLEALQNQFLNTVSQAVLSKVEAFAPDLVLCLAQAPLSILALKKLRAQKTPTAMWFVEDYRLFTYWRAFAPFYDFFAVIQKEDFLDELQKSGIKALYLPLAALPNFHKPLDLTPVEKQEFGAAVSFMGAGYPNRRKAFLPFIGTDFKIWGTEWEDEPRLAPLIQRHGARINPEDTVRIYNATKINLNLHSSVQDKELVSHGDFVNPRTFEIAACGAFQLVDERSLMPELFAKDELATFTSMPDLMEKIAYYSSHPEEREAIATAGRERILKDHTYAIRMQNLLDFVRENLPDFGKHTPTNWPENMPEDTKVELENLLEELHLPANTDFETLVSALRSKDTTLTATETALLFLDEWKKLYRLL